MTDIEIGDMVQQWPDEKKDMDLGVGVILEVLNGGYARKNASVLVYWSSIDTTSFHVAPSMRKIQKC